MKSIMILSSVFLLFTTPVFGELTPADLEQIRSIVKEEGAASEKRMKEYVSQEIGTVNVKIEEMDKRLTGKIEEMDKRLTGKINELDKRLTSEIRGLDKRLDQIFLLVLALIGFMAVVVGVPQILVAMQRRSERAQNEEIEAMKKQIATLQEKMETHKQERMSNP